MTQQELERRLGIAQSHLSALEHGEREPWAGALLAISREFGKSVDWLLIGKEKKEWFKARLSGRTEVAVAAGMCCD